MKENEAKNLKPGDPVFTVNKDYWTVEKVKVNGTVDIVLLKPGAVKIKRTFKPSEVVCKYSGQKLLDILFP